MSAFRLISALQAGFLRTSRGPHLLQPVSACAVQWRPQSSEAVPAARLPCRVKLSAGKRYAWCACGYSKKQPFCDGAHLKQAPSISPLRFTPDKDRTVFLCACKQTKNAPYCDSSHLKVIYRDVVKAVKGLFK
ncbi:CDGSH iron-sulfur domain-containing protein 3, mitochondrial [Oryzias melastigma]|uniref:CDGSH iron-sulfur domain-containing protein 3, mitochondrial n=1 Tax=Oryzias melastigma TaxID=30732 RepID=A0A834C361_ORYME|nr:CDGSH iron-sulfur domain-containing protein 3, mitochondrial [Oryzias melastigma]